MYPKENLVIASNRNELLTIVELFIGINGKNSLHIFIVMCKGSHRNVYFNSKHILKTQKGIVKREYFLLCANLSYVSTVSFVTYYCNVLQTNNNVTPALNKGMFWSINENNHNKLDEYMQCAIMHVLV